MDLSALCKPRDLKSFSFFFLCAFCELRGLNDLIGELDLNIIGQWATLTGQCPPFRNLCF